MLFSGRLKRRCNGGHTVTETALHVVTPLPLADARAPGAVRRQGGECGQGKIKPREPERPQPYATTLADTRSRIMARSNSAKTPII